MLKHPRPASVQKEADEPIKCQPAKLCKRLKVFKSDINTSTPRGFDLELFMSPRSGRGANKGIIRGVAPPGPQNVSRSPIPPQTWWLLNLFLVSFDKLPCLHRDIPLTQPLVIVYTASRQSRRALSGFDSNIHFACEVRYPKWLDHSSLFLQLLPPFHPHSVSAHTNIIWDWRHDSALEKSTIYINIYTLLFLGWGGRRVEGRKGGEGGT